MAELPDTPKVSLLVPIYNAEKYLEQCLDSAAAQTLQDIEIICIDDGSSDSSREIIQRYLDTDPRFRVIDKPNSGYGASMNMGLDAAKGDFIGILESDDFIETEMLETLYKIATKHEAQVVKSNFYFYWSTPEPKDELFEFANKKMCDHIFEPFVEYEVFYMKPSIWSAIYKRDFLEKNEIRFLETPGASYQDSAFNFKVWCAATRAWCTYDAFAHYRQDNEASSVNSPGKVYCICDEYEEMFKYLDEKFPEKSKHLKAVLVTMQYDTYMWNYDRLSDDLKGEWIERFAIDFKHYKDQGMLDYSYFKPWKPRECDFLTENPQLFDAMRRREPLEGRPGLLGKIDSFFYYFNKGGLSWVKKLAKYRR